MTRKKARNSTRSRSRCARRDGSQEGRLRRTRGVSPKTDRRIWAGRVRRLFWPVLRRLSDLGDQLEAYGRVVDFEIFRSDLEAALAYADGAKAGRPPCDPVMMVKILVIQAQNTLSDERTEFLINDRLSFMRFLGLSLGDRVPDATMIWLFREKLTKAGVIEALFARFDQTVRAAGYIPMSC